MARFNWKKGQLFIMFKIFVVGNRLLKQDSLPLRIMEKLSKMLPEVEFLEFDPTENFPEEKEMVILDTVVGLKKAELIENIDSFSLSKAYSLHDFDLGTNLKLMKKAGLLKKVRIIGVPPSLSEKAAVKQVFEKIKSSLF